MLITTTSPPPALLQIEAYRPQGTVMTALAPMGPPSTVDPPTADPPTADPPMVAPHTVDPRPDRGGRGTSVPRMATTCSPDPTPDGSTDAAPPETTAAVAADGVTDLAHVTVTCENENDATESGTEVTVALSAVTVTEVTVATVGRTGLTGLTGLSGRTDLTGLTGLTGLTDRTGLTGLTGLSAWTAGRSAGTGTESESGSENGNESGKTDTAAPGGSTRRRSITGRNTRSPSDPGGLPSVG